jgi:hypothetical protein
MKQKRPILTFYRQNLINWALLPYHKNTQSISPSTLHSPPFLASHLSLLTSHLLLLPSCFLLLTSHLSLLTSLYNNVNTSAVNNTCFLYFSMKNAFFYKEYLVNNKNILKFAICNNRDYLLY